MGVSSLFSCILLLCVQSRRLKAADKTPMGDYFGKVSRKFKDVELWLNVGFGLFWHCILYNLDVYSYIICLSQYVVLSCVLMVILIGLQLLYMTELPQFLSNRLSHSECFRRTLLLLMYEFINIQALKKYVWLYSGYFPCEKSQTCF